MPDNKLYVYCTNGNCDRQDRPYRKDLLLSVDLSGRFLEEPTCPWCGQPSAEPWTELVPEFTVYTDGSCPENVTGGPGGWAAVVLRGIDSPERPMNHPQLDQGRLIRTVSGGHIDTTNNRMEMSGVLAAIRAVEPYSKLLVVSDSQYCVNGFKTWMYSWPGKGWKNSGGKAVLNRDLWEEALALVQSHPHDLDFGWVKGHKGHHWNELADRVAGEEAQKHKLLASGSQV